VEYKNEKILVEKLHDGIAKVTINNPPLNMVTLDLSREMYDSLRKLDRDPEVRVIVITGMGQRAYCVGSDLKEFPGVWDDVVDKKLKVENEAFSQLEQISKPVIAAIEGFAYGGGCEMVQCCDIRIAGEGAKLCLPEINLGVVPGSGAMFRLPKLVGLGIAYELMYLGEPITAQRGYEIGLINKVVKDGEVVNAAIEMAEKIASKSNIAVRVTKRYAREMMEETTAGNYYKNLEMSHLVFASPQCEEGVAAFFEKRTPDFHKPDFDK